MRVLIGGRDGVVAEEISPQIGGVSWILNGIGRMQFSLAANNQKATDATLLPGNRILVEFDNGLPVWGGVIDLPRSWSDGVITVNAYTIEHLLQYRLTSRSTTFDGVPVGAILARTLLEINSAWPEGITLGRTWLGGMPHYPRFHFKSAWDVCESIRRMESCDIVFEPVLENGMIFFNAHLLERWGEDKSDRYAFTEGANIAGLSYTEQGPLVNSAVAAGAGATWTERAVIRAEDSASIQRFGLRERLDIYADATYQTTLEMHARDRLAQAHPLRRFGLEVVDAEPAPFGTYGIGDILRLEAASVGWGYSGQVRVIGMEYNDGVLKLAVDEWLEGQQIFIRQEEAGE
jgi:hypothetical protein